MSSLPPVNAQTYDVYFAAAGGVRFYWRNPNHGMTVGADGLSFVGDGKPRTVGWSDIATVHLQIATLGNARNTVDQCKIGLTDGSAIIVSNSSSSGLPNDAQTRIYRDFVRSLHARLAVKAASAIRFSAGMAPWRYRTLLVAVVAAGLFFVATPLGLTLFTGDWRGLILAATGVAFVWPFTLLLFKNAPRHYAPDRLPEQLLS
jgi:hypothetical protein